MALHKGSWNDRLASMTVGDVCYFPTNLEWYANDMRSVTSPRRPEAMNGMKFKSQLFTAVSASKAGDIRYLIAVERTA